MTKKVTYKEPASYFNKDMMKAAREWEKTHKADKETSTKEKKQGQKKK